MAENQAIWSYGECKIITSSGTTPDSGGWSYGTNRVLHEYEVSVSNAPTGVLDGPLAGPMAGPV